MFVKIDQWILDSLKSIGCDTAKSVLSIDADELVKRTDLEKETINIVVAVRLNAAGLGRLPGRRLQSFAPASRPATHSNEPNTPKFCAGLPVDDSLQRA